MLDLCESLNELADLLEKSNKAGSYYYEDVTLKSWILGPGGRTGNCEGCVENADAGEIEEDDFFPSEEGYGPVDEPPLHPNAVFAGSTFRPYGGLVRMVSAEYDDVAVFLDTGEHNTTIGPNHPMLTERGLVRAKFLRVGDKLLYDCRPVGFSGVSHAKTDLDKVVFVEDYFGALKSSFGLARIAATRDHFHGDAVNDEIEVVLPERKLLHELDPLGLQCLGQIPLMEADVNALIESGESALSQDIERILLTSAGGMGGGDVSHVYQLLTIKDIRISRFKGKAFDAETSIGLYNSDGFVVSNCTCSVIYRDTRRRVYV